MKNLITIVSLSTLILSAYLSLADSNSANPELSNISNDNELHIAQAATGAPVAPPALVAPAAPLPPPAPAAPCFQPPQSSPTAEGAQVAPGSRVMPGAKGAPGALVAPGTEVAPGSGGSGSPVTDEDPSWAENIDTSGPKGYPDWTESFEGPEEFKGGGADQPSPPDTDSRINIPATPDIEIIEIIQVPEIPAPER